jgi:hypothetical protein
VRIVNEKQFGGVLVQPLRANPLDTNYYIPWEGHLWIAMRSKLHPVEMRVHAQGLEVVSGPPVMYNFFSKSRDTVFRYPMTSEQRTQNNLSQEVDDNWDVISLESGETLSAIPKHTLPVSNLHMSHRPPVEIQFGDTGSSSIHAMKTPMTVRQFPPLTEPAQIVQSSTEDDSTVPNVNSTRNPLDMIKSILPIGTSLLDSAQNPFTAAVAAAAVANHAASSASSVEDSEEFLRIVQFAYSLYKEQKATQHQLPPMPSNEISAQAASNCIVPEKSNDCTEIDNCTSSFLAGSPMISFEGENGEELLSSQPPTAAQTPAESSCQLSLIALQESQLDCDESIADSREKSLDMCKESSAYGDLSPAAPLGFCSDNEAHSTCSNEVPNATEYQSPHIETTPLLSEENKVLLMPLSETRSIEETPSSSRNMEVDDMPPFVTPSQHSNSAESDCFPHSLQNRSAAEPQDPLICPTTAESLETVKRRLDLSGASPNSVSDLASPLSTPHHEHHHQSANKKSVRSVNLEKATSKNTRSAAILKKKSRSLSEEQEPSSQHDVNRVTLETALVEVAVSLPPRPPKRSSPLIAAEEPADSSSDCVTRSDADLAATTNTSSYQTTGKKRSRKEAELAELPATVIKETLLSTRSNRPSNARSISKGDSIVTEDSQQHRSNRRAKLQAQQTAKQRDSFLGSWPSRRQSAASGDWKI